ncbi:ribonuclease J [archaeon]|nr:ribonuclease J [archaeon]
MTVEFCSVGGYNEVGRNMSALKYGNEVVLLDMGFYMQKIVDFEEEGGHKQTITANELISAQAIPNDNVIKKWKNDVKAIACSHCHLDHIGAIPYLAPKYNVPILGTPYTVEVIKSTLKNDDIKIKNPLKAVNPNSKIRVSDNIELEFINMTHSTLQTAMIAVHTPDGVILYANDFKFDNHPVLGKKPNYKRLKELGKKGILALVVDSLYSFNDGKTPSEKVAREMLKDVILGTENKGDAVIVTTFASNIARIKSMVDFGHELNRKVVMLGRSLTKYISAAEKIKLINFTKKVELVAYGNKIRNKLKLIEKEGKGRYLIICTGSQAEPNSVLSKIINGTFSFNFRPKDHIIFSCKTIPVEPNITNRKRLEDKLKRKKIRIFTNIHTSGHCSREDLRDLVTMVKPKYIIPAHGDLNKRKPMVELAYEIGYKKKNILLMNNGNITKLS